MMVIIIGALCASKRTGADKLCPGAGGAIASGPSVDPIKHFTPTQSLQNTTRVILCSFFSLIFSNIIDSSYYINLLLREVFFLCFP